MPASPLLTQDEAAALTEKIQSNVAELASLMREAWRGKVWLPLGYDSFADWLDGEFDYSHTRGYQLINIATVTETYATAVTLPENFSLTDIQTRQLIHFGVDEVLSTVQSRSTDDANENVKLISTILRELKKAEQEASLAPETGTPVKLPVRGNQQPRAVHGGEFNTRTAVSSVGALLNQAEALPSPQDLPVATVKTLHDDLHAAIQLARTRLKEFDTAIDGQVQSA
ncbi:hypothetical protein AB0O65_10980 [Microbacterium sp. NPDC077391]|uniref:hypothetical protein n=1 Tax=Microbacterium sp. NPDC077391 TaxID=3154765 RepID=UPI003416D43D